MKFFRILSFAVVAAVATLFSVDVLADTPFERALSIEAGYQAAMPPAVDDGAGLVHVAAMVMAASIVMAQVSDGAIDLGPLFEWILLFVAIVGPPAIYWLLARFTKSKLLADNRDIVLSGLEKAIAFGVARARGELLDLGKIETRNKVVEVAAEYAIKYFPDALAKLGISAEGLRERLLARAEEYLRVEGAFASEQVMGETAGA